MRILSSPTGLYLLALTVIASLCGCELASALRIDAADGAPARWGGGGLTRWRGNPVAYAAMHAVLLCHVPSYSQGLAAEPGLHADRTGKQPSAKPPPRTPLKSALPEPPTVEDPPPPPIPPPPSLPSTSKPRPNAKIYDVIRRPKQVQDLHAAILEESVASSVSGGLMRTTRTSHFDGDALQHDPPTNLALKKKVRLSSSPANSLHAEDVVDGNDSTWITTAGEKSGGWLVVDLAQPCYLDELNLIAPVDSVLGGEFIVSLTSEKSVAFAANASDADWTWRTSVEASDFKRVAVHVHAAGRYLRVQRNSPGRLTLAEVEAMGFSLRPRELAIKSCLTGHDGREVCSGRGVCFDGSCRCEALRGGLRCEYLAPPPSILIASFVTTSLACLILFILLKRKLRVARRGQNLPAYAALQGKLRSGSPFDAYAASPEYDDEKAAFGVNESVVMGSLLSSPVRPPTPMDHASIASHQSAPPPPLPALHFVFSSPLVMYDSSDPRQDDGVVPVAPLAVEREFQLLSQSLNSANASARVEATCGTADSICALLTMNAAPGTVLHVSAHSDRQFLALETSSASAHLLTPDGLEAVVRAGLGRVPSSRTQGVRLVVLNTCFSEIHGERFIRAGIPHVIALRHDLRIRDATAANFSRNLYLALGRARSIGDAFEIARQSVSVSCSEAEADAFVLLPRDANHDEVVWPVLPGRAPARPVPGALRDVCAPATASSAVLCPCDDFVGRAVDVWRIVRLLTELKHRLVVLHGDAGVGKSEVAASLAQHFDIRRGDFKQGVLLVKLARQADVEAACRAVLRAVDDEDGEAVLPYGADPHTMVEQTVRRVEMAGMSRFTNRVLILDDVPSELVATSSAFARLLTGCLRAVAKLSLVLVCRAPSNALGSIPYRCANVLVEQLTALDAATLLIRLCRPKLQVAAAEVPAFDAATGLPRDAPHTNEELESSAAAIAESDFVKELGGNPTRVRYAAERINRASGTAHVFVLENTNKLVRSILK